MNSSEKTVASPAVNHERKSSDWDINNAPRNYLSLVATQFGSAFFSFASVWLITKTIGSEGYGGVVALIAASQAAQILVNWTGYAVVRFGTEEFVETARIARAFWMRLLILVPNFVIVALAAEWWYPPLAAWLKLPAGMFWYVILHISAAAFSLHVQQSLLGAKLPRVQGALAMIERALIFAGISIAVGGKALDTSSALLIYSLMPLAAAAVGVFYLRSYIFARFQPDARFFRRIFAYSLPLLPYALVGYFSTGYVDAIFISNFLSTGDLGVYSIALQINGIALQFPTLANSLLLPLFVTLQKERGSEKTANYFENILPGFVFLWGAGCLAFSLFCYAAIPFIFGAEFGAASVSLWILLSASIFAIPVSLGFSPLSNSSSTTYIPMCAAIFSAAANIAANFLLIPKYGLAGCAAATLIAYLVSFAVFAALLRRAAKIPVRRAFAATIPAAAGALIILLFQSVWWSLIVCLTLNFLVGYLLLPSMRTTLDFLKNFVKAKKTL